ncbi:hypothetical protein AVEN_629-1 [Araneus ventricosus]|uniref:Uncharacterized protein n=1 Tax=Araneus ventricosus TaxID=182803 RepID=A0A4Y2EL54_ARAVE|nr:hypothetical protein AVEN_629-1 [Araneus ventricosus]
MLQYNRSPSRNFTKRWVAWKFGEGVPAQVSSSSSDRGSKLRGPSQNSPRVASKRDINITKPLSVGMSNEGVKVPLTDAHFLVPLISHPIAYWSSHLQTDNFDILTE